jgi:hypothetical protein
VVGRPLPRCSEIDGVQKIFIAARFEIIAASKIPDLNASQTPAQREVSNEGNRSSFPARIDRIDEVRA